MFQILFEFIQNTEDIFLPFVETGTYYDYNTGTTRIQKQNTTLRKLLTDHLGVIKGDFDKLHIRDAIEKIEKRRMNEIQAKRDNLRDIPNKKIEILSIFNSIIDLYDLAIKELEKYELELILGTNVNNEKSNISSKEAIKHDKEIAKKWTPSNSDAGTILNRFNTFLDHEANKESGKKNPKSLKQIVDAAIIEIKKDSNTGGIAEKQLTRYIKFLKNQTAKKYGGHYVRQNFKDKIKGIS